MMCSCLINYTFVKQPHTIIMKKIFLLYFLLLSLFVSAQADFNFNKSNTIVQSNKSIVYITNTGAKYHLGGCSYLRRSSIKINISDAKKSGYTACSRCF